MNRILTIIIGLLSTGTGGLLGVLAVFSLVGFAEQQLPLVVLILVFAMALALLVLGMITLTSYAYETRFDENAIEMQFVFRKELVLREWIRWHRKICFRNAISGGANVWVLLKYTIPDGGAARIRKAVLLVVGTGPSVGVSVKDFQTPFDSWDTENCEKLQKNVGARKRVQAE